jgi:hypothetical protein
LLYRNHKSSLRDYTKQGKVTLQYQ